tara:strand:- start:3955 stop:4593 length:639 start_codon:yes stop_codon:yes gene_type:complete
MPYPATCRRSTWRIIGWSVNQEPASNGYQQPRDVMADSAKVIVKDAEVRRSLDVLTKGAAGAFFDGARAVLFPIMDEIRRQSPRDTGTFAAGWRIEQSISGGDELTVSIVNDTEYGRWVSWSVRMQPSLKAEAKRLGQERRPNSSTAAAAVEALELDPNSRGSLAWLHGSGTLVESFTGRFVFAEVRKMGVRMSRRFIDAQSDNLIRLAGGG